MIQRLQIQKLLCVFLGLLYYAPIAALPPLQLYVEITPAGGVLKPPPGDYAGPVVIKRPITIDGGGKVTINGNSLGTVVTVLADKTVLKGLHISNSGRSHNTVDAGILIKANQTVIENNIIDDVLFGIHLSKADNNTIQNNTISSLERDISIRGDGIRLWYSNDNLIQNNTMFKVRDITLNNSTDNHILGNLIQNSRIGMELIYSHNNEVANNTIANNITGIVVIYSNNMSIHNNNISHMRQLTGAGISLKESAEALVSNNEIAHCAIGLQANSPLDPENKMTAKGNLFTYNVLGMYFYGEKGGHIIQNNNFENNFTDVLGSGAMTVLDNKWGGNYWDKYQGFDKNHNDIGDKPYNVYLYSERIWVDNPKAKFFRGSPVMGMLDFSLKLAPFKQPSIHYSDPTPKFSRN